MKHTPILAALTIAFSLALGISAQTNQSSNELEGYRFVGSGKLKSLQLLVSTRDDVKRVFGNQCEKQCDYDADWTVNFEYYDDIWTKESSNNRGEKWTYFLDSKYLGKLRTIDLKPKNPVSFAKVTFPDTFKRVIVTATSDKRSGSIKTVNNAYQDANGLIYELFGQTSQSEAPGTNARPLKPGDLVLIRYTISKEREKSLFVLQK